MSVQRVSVIRVNPNRSSAIRAHPYKQSPIEIPSNPQSNGRDSWNRQIYNVQESDRSPVAVRRSPIVVQQIRVKSQRKSPATIVNNQSSVIRGMQHPNPIDIAIKQEIESCNNNQITEMVKPAPVYNQIQTATSKQPVNRRSISPSSFMKPTNDTDFESNPLKSKL